MDQEESVPVFGGGCPDGRTKEPRAIRIPFCQKGIRMSRRAAAARSGDTAHQPGHFHFVWDRPWEGALAGTSTKVLCLAATTSVSYAGVGYWLVRIRETP